MADRKQDQERKPEQEVEHSGDHSGVGRPRRDDGEVFPQHRSRDDFGTHGGANRHAPSESEEPGKR